MIRSVALVVADAAKRGDTGGATRGLWGDGGNGNGGAFGSGDSGGGGNGGGGEGATTRTVAATASG